MKSLSIGHFTNVVQATGISVFLFDKPAVAAYCLPGAAPATRGLAIVDSDSNSDGIDALVLTGGSAFGLGVTDGVMQWLKENKRGVKMPHKGVVPIVPTAAIYDLAVGAAVSPTANDAYQACCDAKAKNFAQGKIGAGTGASVGKLVAHTNRMSGGLGVAQIKLKSGLQVIAYAVVNAVGDVRDETGDIIAGAKLPNGQFADCRKVILSNQKISTHYAGKNTTLVAVFTNALFTKNELKRIAKMAIAGMAQAVTPIFTEYDGDALFCVSLGHYQATELTVGTLAVEAVRQAIVNAVKNSTVLK